MPDGFSGIAPHRDIVEAFVAALFCSADATVRLRFIHDSERGLPAVEREGKVADLWPDIVAHQNRGFGTFYFLNECRRGPGSGQGGAATDRDISAIRALATDHDLGLPDDWEWHANPRLVVRTSQLRTAAGGIQKGHALWPVADLGVAGFKAAQMRLAAHYHTDTSISNPSRVLRLPGTYHLKDPANPQLVTFEDCANRGCRDAAADILAGLPQLAAREAECPNIREYGAVELADLREVLGYLDPNAERPEWLRVIGALRATPVPNDEDEAARRRLAHQFSEGKLDRQDRYSGCLPTRYTGAADVDRAFDTMPPKSGGVTFGTLYALAQRTGYQGGPTKISAAVIFRDYAAALESNRPAAGSREPGTFLLSMADIFALPDPTELVDGLLMDGESVCFVGPPKVGKTFIALDIAMSLAAGTPVFGQLPIRRTGPVVYLSGEGHAGMKRRLKAWCQERGIHNAATLPFYYKAGVPMTRRGAEECAAFIAGIMAHLSDQRPALVVIDTMARSMSGLNENDAGDANMYLDLTDGLRNALRCTCLTLAHSGKDPKAAIDIRGSSAFLGGFDAVWTAEMNEANRTVKLTAKWLKEADDLGPFCFRMRQVTVEGMTLGKGAVLDYVPLSEFAKTTAMDDRKKAREHVAATLAKYNITSLERALSTHDLAERIAGAPPRPSDRIDYERWKAAVAREEQHLDNNSRPPRAGKVPLYEGFFEHLVRDGSKRATKFWFLPPGGDAEEPAAA